MNKENNNIPENKLQRTWEELNETKFSNQKLEKQEIMKAIKQKSKLTTEKIKTNLKKEGIFHSISLVLILYIFISGIIHNASHNPNQELLLFFQATTIFTFLAYFLFITNLFIKHSKIKLSPISSTSNIEQLKYNVRILNSLFKFERIWIAIIVSIGSFLMFTFYSHGSDHSESFLVLFIISIILVIASVLITDYNNRKRYGNELKALKQNILEFDIIQKEE